MWWASTRPSLLFPQVANKETRMPVEAAPEGKGKRKLWNPFNLLRSTP